MAAQPHHSIGEVLSLLQAEYSDVTISKIRFLESQGLIAPERTPSGYRKFYPSDVARLRWILIQQRDNFLPLKVIKKRLEEPGLEVELEALMDEAAEAEPTLFANRGRSRADLGAAAAHTKVRAVRSDSDGVEDSAGKTGADAGSRPSESTSAKRPASKRPAPKRTASKRPAAENPEKPTPEPSSEPVPAAASKVAEPQAADEAEAIDEHEKPLEGFSAIELAEAAEIEVGLVRELARLGLIVSTGRPGSGVYGPEALETAKAAAVFGRSGLEPRHLRMYKVSAERQAGLLEQIFAPRLARGGDAAGQAQAELNELVRLGEALQRSVLRRSFGESLDG